MTSGAKITKFTGARTFEAPVFLLKARIHFLKAVAYSHHDERNLRVMHQILQAVGHGLKDYPPLIGVFYAAAGRI